MFELGGVYSRSALHQQFGGQPHSRISTPAGQDVILVFANHRGSVSNAGIYTSGWTKYGIFRFIGEGRFGHMSFTRGNRALRNHRHSGKRVHLFVRLSSTQPSEVRYEGEFVYQGHFYKEGYDERNHIRRMIVFILKPHQATHSIASSNVDSDIAQK